MTIELHSLALDLIDDLNGALYLDRRRIVVDEAHLPFSGRGSEYAGLRLLEDQFVSFLTI